MGGMHSSSNIASEDVVQDFDITKYTGLWYELGRYPVWFESGCDNDVTARYTILTHEQKGEQSCVGKGRGRKSRELRQQQEPKKTQSSPLSSPVLLEVVNSCGHGENNNSSSSSGNNGGSLLTKKGIAREKFPGKKIGQLEVSFFPLIWSDYNILALYSRKKTAPKRRKGGGFGGKPKGAAAGSASTSSNDEYQVSIVVSYYNSSSGVKSGYRNLWILCRTPHLYDSAQVKWIENQCRKLQIDSNKLKWNHG